MKSLSTWNGTGENKYHMEPEESNPQQPGRYEIPLWFALMVMVVALAGAALILSRVAGPLYGLLFPFDPPVPDGAHQIEHVKPKKGSEYWIYRTTQPGMDVAAFYEKHGGTCSFAPRPGDESGLSSGPYNVATCTGQKKTGGLVTSWEVSIAEGYSEEEGPTIFRLYKFSEIG
jgi:hypothetical protein